MTNEQLAVLLRAYRAMLYDALDAADGLSQQEALELLRDKIEFIARRLDLAARSLGEAVP